MHWLRLGAIATALMLSAVANVQAEAQQRNADCGHCENWVCDEIGEANFQNQISVIVADFARQERAWQMIQRSADQRLQLSQELAIHIIGQFSSHAKVGNQSLVPASAISPSMLLIRTVWQHPQGQLQNYVWFQHRMRSTAKQLFGYAKTLQLLNEIETITTRATQLAQSWAASMIRLQKFVSNATTRETTQVTDQPGKTEIHQDDYWDYYADCDHWQVTFGPE